MVVGITERKRTEEALRASEERLRAIFNSTAVGAAILTPAARFIEVNDAFCAMTGYSREELDALDCGALTHPDDRAPAQARIDALLAGRTAGFVIEKRYIRKDGGLIWVQTTVSPVRDASGKPRHLVAITLDITDRKNAEAALRQSRENLMAAMAASGTGTFRWNPHTGEPVESDDTVKRLFGFAAGDPVGVAKDFLRRLHPDDMRKVVQGVAACRSGADFSMECRVLLPDGGIRWLHGQAKMQRDSQGHPTYLVGACTDITKRKRAEEAVREGEEQFRTLAESIPQLAWMANSDGWIFWYNRRWYDYTGTTIEEMQGWGWRKVHHPDHEARVVEHIQRSWNTGEPWEDLFPLRGADGNYRWFLSRALPIRDAAGRIARWFGTNTDVTEQREAQEVLRRLSQTLEQRVAERTRQLTAETAERQKAQAALHQALHLEALGRLTGGVAHDFNNLLTVVVGEAELIIATATDESTRRRALAIGRAADRGARLTAQLLAFSRRQKLRPETVRIDRLVASIDDLVRGIAGEAVEVAFATAPDLWRSLIDPAQFESAILNLAINARDAMPGGGRLVIAARNAPVSGSEAVRLDIPPGDYVVVSVADTGTGMPAKVRARAFEPFFTTKEVGKGTGLGLAQVYGFVGQSGGAVGLESIVGRGTTVTLYLPRATAEAAEEKAAPSPPIAAAEGRGKTIMVVEDQPEVRDVIEASLSRLGYRIVTASDGAEARTLLENDRSIDLLLTDIVMPNGVSGLDLAHGAKRLRRDLKVVLISGYSGDAQIRAGGPDDEFIFLEKPFRQAQLARSIAAALGAGHGC